MEKVHLIGKKAKQKKTLERRDEVTTFCLTVNEKRHNNKVKITDQRHHTSNVRKQSLRTEIYSNPLTRCEHADRRAVSIGQRRTSPEKLQRACSLIGGTPPNQPYNNILSVKRKMPELRKSKKMRK